MALGISPVNGLKVTAPNSIFKEKLTTFRIVFEKVGELAPAVRSS